MSSIMNLSKSNITPITIVFINRLLKILYKMYLALLLYDFSLCFNLVKVQPSDANAHK